MLAGPLYMLQVYDRVERYPSELIEDVGRYLTNAQEFLFLGLAVFIVFAAARQFRQLLNAPMSPGRLPSALYSPRLRRTARIAVVATLLMFVVLVAALLFVDPLTQCPGWHLPDQRSTSLWLPVSWSALVLAALSFMVVRWT